MTHFAPLALCSGYVHPFMLYGTAWKGEQTGSLTELSLKLGFKGFDTANYPSAYEESLSGDGLQAYLRMGKERRELCVQTKFTPAWAHAEGKIPFNTNQDLKDQVRESIEQSFKHLNVDFIDLFLLHVPFQDEKDNLIAWKVFEEYVPHRIGALGISNVELPLFRFIYERVSIKPQVVQNRFWRETNYDIDLREYLASKGVIYQAYHLLKANQEILSSDILAQVAAKLDISKQLALYMLVLGLGKVSILNGTTNKKHMTEDITEMKRVLEDVEKLEGLISVLPAFENLLSRLSRDGSSI